MTSSRYQVVEVARVDSKLQVTWGDGHSSQYPGIWLINACDCGACGSTISAVRHRKLTDVAPRPELASAQIDVDVVRQPCTSSLWQSVLVTNVGSRDCLGKPATVEFG